MTENKPINNTVYNTGSCNNKHSKESDENAFSHRVLRKGFYEEMVLDKDLNRARAKIVREFRGESILDKGSGICQGPEAGTCLGSSQESGEASVAQEV